MFEKTIVTALKGLSLISYIFIMLALFSAPVIFIYQAFMPPVFSFESVSFYSELQDDEYLTAIGENPEDWQKMDCHMTATAGKMSPYNFTIAEFYVEPNEILEDAEDYKVIIDKTLEFSKTETEEFTLTLYVKSDEKVDFAKLAEISEFKAKSYEKSFSQFSVTYEADKEKDAETEKTTNKTADQVTTQEATQETTQDATQTEHQETTQAA